MNRAGILIISGLLSVRMCCGGGFSSDSIGTTGAQFLNTGAGARAIGLGGAYTAVSDDSSGIYWNPAGLTQISNTSVMFMHTNYLADINFDYLAFAHKRDSYAFGAALSYMNAGDIQQTDVGGNSLGAYNPRDYVGIISLAMKTNGPFDPDELGFFSIGINAKILKSCIIEKAEAFAIDAGILGKSIFRSGDKNIRFGFAVQNLGPKIKFDKEEDSLPLTLKAGMALESKKRLLLSGDVVFPKSNQPYIAIGFEYRMNVLNKTSAALRFGGNTLTLNSLEGLNGLSAGLGVKLNVVSIDYAISGFGELGSSQKISISFNFGGEDESAKDLNSSKKSKSWRTAAEKPSGKTVQKDKSAGNAAGWSWIW